MLTLCVKELGGGTKKLCLACGTHTIGRDENNDIVLSDNDVARTHARITCEDNRFFIEGMEGAKGVYLNDGRITGKCRLENGTALKIGGTEIQVSLAPSDEIQTMAMIPSDEEATLLLEDAATPKSEGEEDGTVILVEDELPIHREENELNQDDTTLKFVDRHRIPPLNKTEEVSKIRKNNMTRTLAVIAASIFLFLAAFFYIQVNLDIKKSDKSEAKKKPDELSELERKPERKSDASISYDKAPADIHVSEDNAAKANRIIHQGLTYYMNGNVEKALKELGKIALLDLQESASLKTKAATYQKMISQTEALYLEGEKAFQQGQPEAAFQVWARVLEIDHRLIGQKSSLFSNSISEYMCSEFAKRARRAFDNADYEEAYKNSQKALAIKPGLQRAVEINHRLTERAEKLYGKASILEELDPEMAIRKWREILTITSPDNTFYKKASRRLANY